MAIGMQKVDRSENQPKPSGNIKTKKAGTAKSVPANTSKKPVSKKQVIDSESEEEYYDEDGVDIDLTEKKKIDPKFIIAGAAGIALIGIIIFLWLGNNGNDASSSSEEESSMYQETEVYQDTGELHEVGGAVTVGDIIDQANEAVESTAESIAVKAVTDEEGNPVYDINGNVLVDGGIEPGTINEYSGYNINTPPAEVFDESDFIKDLNGANVAANYSIASTTYTFDYVTYTIKRAIIDEGMELFWMDVDYRGKKYRVQLPWYKFKRLMDNGTTGICKVRLEIQELVGGGRIITYMELANDDNTVD